MTFVVISQADDDESFMRWAGFLMRLDREVELQKREQELSRLEHYAYRGSKPDVYRAIYAGRTRLRTEIAAVIGERTQ